MHALVCVTFSLPPCIRGWLRLLLVAFPGLFCLPFCYIAFDILSFDILIFIILGRSSKHKQAKYHSIDSKDGKPSLLSTSSETSSVTKVSSDDDSGDPSDEFRMSNLNFLNSLAFSGGVWQQSRQCVGSVIYIRSNRFLSNF